MLAACITIDTEADHDTRWRKTAPLRFRSIVEGIPSVYAPLFAHSGARPTYLLTTEVMNDAASVETLKQIDGELGTHLHGDHVAPAARLPDPSGAHSWDFTCCYEPAIERAKLETITRQFADRFGRMPRVYRAGRYAASGHTARVLAELGYVADTSVTPGILWTQEQRPSERLDFRHARRAPYRPSESDLARPGALPIWEVPVTILPRPRAWNAAIGVLQRAVRRPVQAYPLWLRPSTTSWPWLRWAIGRVLDEDRDAPLTVFNIMLHSMEIIEGASPYSSTPASVRRIVGRLDRLCRELRRIGARFLTLSELAAELDAREGLTPIAGAAHGSSR